jgi:predicted small lipoprotein YifL
LKDALVMPTSLARLTQRIVTLALGCALLMGGVSLVGCGQKGPLYIPEPASSEESEDSDS